MVYDPFMLADQGIQVYYYLTDPKTAGCYMYNNWRQDDNGCSQNPMVASWGPIRLGASGSWRIVKTIMNMNVYDIPPSLENTQETKIPSREEAYQEEESFQLFINFGGFNLVQLCRDDVDLKMHVAMELEKEAWSGPNASDEANFIYDKSTTSEATSTGYASEEDPLVSEREVSNDEEPSSTNNGSGSDFDWGIYVHNTSYLCMVHFFSYYICLMFDIFIIIIYVIYTSNYVSSHA